MEGPHPAYPFITGGFKQVGLDFSLQKIGSGTEMTSGPQGPHWFSLLCPLRVSLAPALPWFP